MLKRLSESELDIMLIIWRAPEALDTGKIARRLQKGWKIQAVQVILGRLVNKGYVSCEKIGRLNYYTPLVPQMCIRDRNPYVSAVVKDVQKARRIQI